MSQTPPDAADLSFRLEGFETDAKYWDDNAEKIGEVKTMVDGLEVDVLAFGPMEWGGLGTTYNEIRQKVSTLSGDGDSVMGEIGAKLRESKQEYEQAEANNTHAAKGQW